MQHLACCQPCKACAGSLTACSGACWILGNPHLLLAVPRRLYSASRCSGQAWAIVGYTHAYDATREPELLATAQVASDYFLKRLAEADDGVPLW